MDTLFNLINYSSFPEWDEYEIYHDESKDNHIIHGLLLVPNRIKEQLLAHINKIREKHNCDSKLHFSKLTGATENIKHKTARDILALMADALRSKGHEKHLWGTTPPRCKFILFFKKSASKMNSQYFLVLDKTEVYTRKVETLLRIGLKGGLHYLFDKTQKVKIQGFYTDGKAWSRPLDKTRIIKRLYNEKNEYIDFDQNMDIVPVLSNHKDKDCNDVSRANLLQASDLLLGAFKTCIFPHNEDSFKYKVSKPIREIMVKQKTRKSLFRRSGHHKSFVLTKSSILKDGKWEYAQFSLHEDKNNPKNKFNLELQF